MEGLLTLSRNIDIANMWLNYCTIFPGGFLCLLLFYKIFIQLSQSHSFACMNSHILKYRCLACLIYVICIIWNPAASKFLGVYTIQEQSYLVIIFQDKVISNETYTQQIHRPSFQFFCWILGVMLEKMTILNKA